MVPWFFEARLVRALSFLRAGKAHALVRGRVLLLVADDSWPCRSSLIVLPNKTEVNIDEQYSQCHSFVIVNDFFMTVFLKDFRYKKTRIVRVRANGGG